MSANEVVLQEEPHVPTDLHPLSTFSSAKTIYNLHRLKPVDPEGGRRIDSVFFF